MRRCTMRFNGDFITINLVEIIDVLICIVLQDIEADATWLILFRAEGVDFYSV